MNKNRLFAALAASALTFSLLAGCGAADKPENPTPDGSNAPSASTPTPPVDDATKDDAATGDAAQPVAGVLADLVAALGKPDGEVTAQLGDGTASESDGTLIAREYTLDVFGEQAPVSVIYGDGATVSEVSITFATTSYDDALKQMTEAQGEPKDQQENQESGGKNATWSLDGATATLAEAYGTVFLSLTAA